MSFSLVLKKKKKEGHRQRCGDREQWIALISLRSSLNLYRDPCVHPTRTSNVIECSLTRSLRARVMHSRRHKSSCNLYANGLFLAKSNSASRLRAKLTSVASKFR